MNRLMHLMITNPGFGVAISTDMDSEYIYFVVSDNQIAIKFAMSVDEYRSEIGEDLLYVKIHSAIDSIKSADMERLDFFDNFDDGELLGNGLN